MCAAAVLAAHNGLVAGSSPAGPTTHARFDAETWKPAFGPDRAKREDKRRV